MIVPQRFFKLSNHLGSLGLSCNEDGLALAGVPLTSRGEENLRPRSRAELQVLMARAYGDEADISRLEAGLSAIAKALNTGEIARAMAAAVLLRLPDLDWEGAVRIAQADEMLVKYGEDQPRDWHGRWTDGSGGELTFSENDLVTTTANPDTAPVSVNTDRIDRPAEEQIDTRAEHQALETSPGLENSPAT